MEQQETSYLCVKFSKENRPSLYTSSTTEQSGVTTTNKRPNVKWLGWRARGRLERRAFTARRIYTYTFIHSQYEQANHTTHNPLTIYSKLDTPPYPKSQTLTNAPTFV
jgi:hypothetical protein